MTAVLPELNLLDQVLLGRLVEPLFQPLIDLDRDVTVGYEALVRGPQGPLHRPAALFEVARRSGRLTELDWLCRERAVEVARGSRLRHPLSLFINAEPETLLASDGDAQRWSQFGDLRCYAELTERALAARPAALLRAVDQVREQDWGIAMDDVGADPASLALLPVVRPDVIKLDLHLLHTSTTHSSDTAVATTLHAALAQAAQSGAVVVAEGIETPQQLDLARALGAHYGQGYLLGRPGPLPSELNSPPLAVPLLPRLLNRAVPPSPFAVAASSATSRPITRSSVIEIARQLLAQAGALTPDPIVLVCVDDPALLDPALTDLLVNLRHHSLVAVLSRAVLSRLPGVRAETIQGDDPAQHDFDVVVLGTHFAAALVSRPVLSGHGGGMRDSILTFDPGLVSAAASALLRRLP